VKPHKPGEYTRRKRRQPAPAKKRPAIAKHPVKAKAKPGPRLRETGLGADQLSQFTGIQRELKKQGRKELKGKRLFRITDQMLMNAKGSTAGSVELARRIFAAAKPLPTVIPKDNTKALLAMDENISLFTAWAAQSIYNGAFQQGVTFLGYPYLAELAQRGEYRRVSEVIATEMTRKWIEVKAHSAQKLQVTLAETEGQDTEEEDLNAGGPEEADELEGNDPSFQYDDETANDKAPVAWADTEQQAEQMAASLQAEPAQQQNGEAPTDPNANIEADGEADIDVDGAVAESQPSAPDKTAKIKELNEELERLNVQAIFKSIAEQDGFFGRAHLYIDTGHTDNLPELKMPIGDGQDQVSMAKLQVGSIKALKTVEAIWCYPANYDSFDPLKSDWYRPCSWFVQGKEVHSSRLLTFVGREVPDMLKPAYSFGGLSLSQMIKPVVDNWLNVRQSVADIIKAFTVFVLKTNLATLMMEDGDQVTRRADYFNATRSNRGVMMVDKETEDFANVSAPLGSLDKLQAQAQEHICSLSGLPLVKYTGISPSGLNATSEFEIQVFYDWVRAYQMWFFAPNLTRVFHMAQINLWGAVDPDLYYEFLPLQELSEKDRGDMEKSEADRDKVLIDAGVLHAEEVRARLSQEDSGPYAGIDVNNVPEPPMPPGGEDPFGREEGFDEEGPGGKGEIPEGLNK
jgi:phage-related protein (TIGR01555 family)